MEDNKELENFIQEMYNQAEKDDVLFNARKISNIFYSHYHDTLNVKILNFSVIDYVKRNVKYIYDDYLNSRTEVKYVNKYK